MSQITVVLRGETQSRSMTIYGTDLETVLADIREDQNERKRRVISIDRQIISPPEHPEKPQPVAPAQPSGQHLDVTA
jgi:hypothetical protein